MEFENMYDFESAVRGYHYYKKYWQPEVNQILYLSHEKDNHFDSFAIKMCDVQGTIRGHLPMEISRVTKFLLDRGAKITATLRSTNYRRSPLVQGGLEIPCSVKVMMMPTQLNKRLVNRYKDLVEIFYFEPPDNDIIGSFLQEDIAISNTASTRTTSNGEKSSKKKTKTIREKDEVAVKDIRSFFKKTKTVKSTTACTDSITILDD